MSIWRWAHLFSTVPELNRLTLGEGDTPVLRSRHIGPRAGLSHLYFKLETTNPSGSYKDRFAAAAISDMLANHKTRCIATSSGNTGSALAAYCAAAGIECEIAIVETAPLGKLQQMMAYGANIYKVRGFGISSEITTNVMEALRRKSSAADSALQISAFLHSPIGMAGVKTISYELAEQIGGELKHVFSPAGGGGLTLAVAAVLKIWKEQIKTKLGQPFTAQPKGNDTIASALRTGSDRALAVSCTTQISGLQVASVLDGHDVIAACRRSGGTGHLVTDEAVWKMQSRLAKEEGIFCEPAGAVSVVAALQAWTDGTINDEPICCLVTGSGFKDTSAIARLTEQTDCPLIELI